MDRFEEIAIINQSILNNIYIPVWIDLKRCKRAVRIWDYSSMDRFKA